MDSCVLQHEKRRRDGCDELTGEYRGRLAPSPTGLLHAGHARTFWTACQRAAAAARSAMVMRMDDLDGDRCRQEFVDASYEDLRWLGLEWQEGPDVGGPHGPYLQTGRMHLYRAALGKLAGLGLLYPCSCSRKDIASALSAPHQGDEEPVYPGTCRPRTPPHAPLAAAGADAWLVQAYAAGCNTAQPGTSPRAVDGAAGAGTPPLAPHPQPQPWDGSRGDTPPTVMTMASVGRGDPDRADLPSTRLSAPALTAAASQAVGPTSEARGCAVAVEPGAGAVDGQGCCDGPQQKHNQKGCADPQQAGRDGEPSSDGQPLKSSEARRLLKEARRREREARAAEARAARAARQARGPRSSVASPEKDGPLAPVRQSMRFRVPDGLSIRFIDNCLGPQELIAGRDFGDFIVWRHDGMPSYQLACIVDDAAMRISEVVRGADLLVSTARQLILARALGVTAPAYYHAPLVADPVTHARLAKRHDALSLRALRERGAGPAAVLNQPLVPTHDARRALPSTTSPTETGLDGAPRSKEM